MLLEGIGSAPGCLVLDIHMPGPSGLDLQEMIATQPEPLPVIFVTAEATVHETLRAMKAGAADFLFKPVDGEALGRSYWDLWRRGHLKGTGALAIGRAFAQMAEVAPLPAAREISEMCKQLEEAARSISRGELPAAKRDYLSLLERHGRRRGAAE